MSDEKFKGKLDKYLKPDNCKQFKVSTVNLKFGKRSPPPPPPQGKRDLKNALSSGEGGGGWLLRQ